MSQSPKVTLEFLSRQLDRVLTRLGAIEDQITVLRGLLQAVNGADHRLRKLEDQEEA